MKKIILLPFLIIIIAILVGAFSFTASVPPNAGTWISFHIQLAVAAIMGFFYMGAVLLFLLGLKQFTLRLKLAYVAICVGLIILAIAQIQLPLFQGLNLWSSSWVENGDIQIPYIIAGIIIFSGIRKLSKLLSIKIFWNSWLISGATVAILTLLIYFGREMVYPYRSGQNIITGIPFILVLIPPILFSISALLILKIKQKTSATYTNALAWFFMWMSILSIAQWQVVIFSIIGFDSFWVSQGYFQLVYLFSGLILLKAGYTFNKIKIY